MVGQRLETVTQNAAGEVFPIELTATEMRVADRRLIFGSIRDLRDKLRAEEEINRQRENAQKALGPKFDLKAFNDTVVLGGNVPLDVLAKNVDEYVRANKPAGA